MSWTVADSLLTLRRQVNTLAPRRDTHADGTIGDATHQAQSWSDHNPDDAGIVRALDLTHDPAGGLNCDELAEELAASRDPRIKYLIWKRRVIRSYTSKTGEPPWTWTAYTGDNPHTTHLHISVVADNRALSPAEWKVTLMGSLTVTNPRTRKPWALPAALWSIWTYVLDARDRIVVLTAKVDAIAQRVDLSPAELAAIEQRARAAIAAELDKREETAP